MHLAIPDGTLCYIDAPHFMAGFIVNNGKVVFAAPIIRYMLNWSEDRVRSYCKEKRWKVMRTNA